MAVDKLGKVLYNDPTNGGKKSFDGQLANSQNIKANQLKNGFIYKQDADHTESYSPETWATAAQPTQIGRPATKLTSKEDLSFSTKDYGVKENYKGIKNNIPASTIVDYQAIDNSNLLKGIKSESIAPGSYYGVPVDHIVPMDTFMPILRDVNPTQYQHLLNMKSQIEQAGGNYKEDLDFQNALGEAKAGISGSIDANLSNSIAEKGSMAKLDKSFRTQYDVASKLNSYGSIQAVGPTELDAYNKQQAALQSSKLESTGITNPLFYQGDLSKQESFSAKSKLVNSKAFLDWAKRYFKGSENTSLYKDFVSSFQNHSTLSKFDKDILRELSDTLEKDGLKDEMKKYQYDDDFEERFGKDLVELYNLSFLSFATREDDLKEELLNNFSFSYNANSSYAPAGSANISTASANFY